MSAEFNYKTFKVVMSPTICLERLKEMACDEDRDVKLASLENHFTQSWDEPSAGYLRAMFNREALVWALRQIDKHSRCKRQNRERRTGRRLRKWQLPANCFGCDAPGTYKEVEVEETMFHRGIAKKVMVPKWACDQCGNSFISPEQATRAYQRLCLTV